MCSGNIFGIDVVILVCAHNQALVDASMYVLIRAKIEAKERKDKKRLLEEEEERYVK